LVFSAKPLGQRGSGDPLTEIWDHDLRDLAETASSGEVVAIKVGGKKPTPPGRLDYFFGLYHDASNDDRDMPWNNGESFHWTNWARYSPDVWDNLCIALLPNEDRQRRGSALIEHVAVRKGGTRLFDSRVTTSYSNGRPIDPRFKPRDLWPGANGRRYPLLNLADHMERFRNDYYELGNNPILTFAYSELGQRDKRKYTNQPVDAWCSEFVCFVYRSNGIPAPDPNSGDIGPTKMTEFCEESGQIYPATEVAQWPDARKRATIKPGSFVLKADRDGTHSIIFTTWNVNAWGRITGYAGISGNNGDESVRAHNEEAFSTPAEAAVAKHEPFFCVLRPSIRGRVCWARSMGFHSNRGLAGASVQVGERSTTTDSGGLFDIEVEPGYHTVTVFHPASVRPMTKNVHVPRCGSVFVTIEMFPRRKPDWVFP
jgi:hypothetical protein